MWNQWHKRVLNSEEAPEEWQHLQWRYRMWYLLLCVLELLLQQQKIKIPKVYSYTVIVWAAIPHSGQLNRSNSTLVKFTGLLKSNPIWKEDCPLLFTVKSPAVQLLWNPPRDGITQSVRSLVPPSSSSIQMRPRAAGLLHPPLWCDPSTSGRVCRLSCATGGKEGSINVTSLYYMVLAKLLASEVIPGTCFTIPCPYSCERSRNAWPCKIILMSTG